VYEELLDRAARLLELGESVVLDASWIESDRRDAARALAEKTSSDIYEMRCEVSEAEGALRVDRRLSAHSDPSEASPEVAAAMRGSMDAWGQATVVDTSGRTAEQGIALALAALSD
jgi:predicted kinase